MLGTYFYHEKIRKCVAIFGRLFNNIYVLRKDAAYAPRRKYLERILESPDLSSDTQVAIKLPRMSFEIVTFLYDTTRQLTKTSNFMTTGTSSSNRQKFFSPVPYTINFQLNIYAKSQDDALQVVEQIIPYFNPQYSLTIKPFPSEYPDFKEDIPIIIQGLSFQDDFEGAIEARRTIIYTIDFEMKVSFHGPIATSSIIRQADAALFDIGAGLNDSDVGLSTVRITPNPIDAIGLADSDFGFTTTILDSA